MAESRIEEQLDDILDAINNGGGGGGGSSTLAGLTDVQLTSPANGQALVYNGTSRKWVNGAGGSFYFFADDPDDNLVMD